MEEFCGLSPALLIVPHTNFDSAGLRKSTEVTSPGNYLVFLVTALSSSAAPSDTFLVPVLKAAEFGIYEEQLLSRKWHGAWADCPKHTVYSYWKQPWKQRHTNLSSQCSLSHRDSCLSPGLFLPELLTHLWHIFLVTQTIKIPLMNISSSFFSKAGQKTLLESVQWHHCPWHCIKLQSHQLRLGCFPTN